MLGRKYCWLKLSFHQIREYQKNGWDLQKLYYNSEYIERKQYERREFSDIQLNQFKKTKELNQISSSTVNSSDFHSRAEKHGSYKNDLIEYH